MNFETPQRTCTTHPPTHPPTHRHTHPPYPHTYTPPHTHTRARAPHTQHTIHTHTTHSQHPLQHRNHILTILIMMIRLLMMIIMLDRCNGICPFVRLGRRHILGCNTHTSRPAPRLYRDYTNQDLSLAKANVLRKNNDPTYISKSRNYLLPRLSSPHGLAVDYG